MEIKNEIEAESGEGFERARKEALPTGFVDGGTACVEDFDSKALTSGGDGAGQAGRSCPNDAYVALIWALGHSVLSVGRCPLWGAAKLTRK